MEDVIAVSVIIPVFNAEPYLNECLDSVVNQSLRTFEVICIDDGSTDHSLEILHRYEAQDARITVLTQQHMNAGAARNRGLDLAKGEYLSFLDADDFFEPDMLEKAYQTAKQRDAEIVVFRGDDYDSSENRFSDCEDYPQVAVIPQNQPFAGTEVDSNLFTTVVGWAWDKLFLREYVRKNGFRFQEQRTSNDLYFTYLALAKASRIVTMDDVLVHHRVHLHTSLEATRERSWDCFYRALCALREGLKREGLFSCYEKAFVNYAVSFSLWNLFTISWPTQEVMFYLLKYTWLQEFGITEHDEDYFVNKKQFREIRSVLEEDYTSVFPNGSQIVRYQAELDRRAEEISALQDELNRIAFENSEQQLEITRLLHENACKQAELDAAVAEIAAIHDSATYKIGRFATFLPRRIRTELQKQSTGDTYEGQ